MRPYSPIPRFVRSTDHGRYIHRVLRKEIDPDVQRIDLITTTFLRVSIIDSGTSSVAEIAEGDTCVHVLWQAHEVGAEIDIEGERHPIAPGDTAWVPAGDAWWLSPNQVAIQISMRSHALALPIAPTHGEDRFVGHNRESQYPSPGLSVCRWKLTEPLTISEPDRDVILIGLYNDIALQWEGGVSMLPQGEAVALRPAPNIRPGTGQITLVPNGLSYVLVIG